MARHQYRRYRSRWWLLLVAITVCPVAALFVPWALVGFVSHPHPAQTYTDALDKLDALGAQETAPMNPVCRAQLMTHGRAVDRVIVLVHGYTSCPQQFHTLGERFYQLGYNVLIAPLPHHGLADLMNTAQGELVAEELAAYADAVVDIADGLGSEVTMLGFSVGGTTAAWAAQQRHDLKHVVLVSPAFGFQPVPAALTIPAMNVARLLPDKYTWWHPEVQDRVSDGAYAYPRYSRRVLGQVLRLGFSVQADAKRQPPATHAISVVTNLADPSVNNDVTATLVSIWQRQGADVTTATFAAELHLGHDLIDPTQPDQQIDVVYPRLIEIVTQG